MSAREFFALVVRMRMQQKAIKLLDELKLEGELSAEVMVDREIERVRLILEQRGEKIFWEDDKEHKDKVAK